MDAQIKAEQDMQTYHRVKVIRRMAIEEFLEELKDKMDRITYADGNPRAGGSGPIMESEDRGYHHGIAQIQSILRDIRASL